MNMVKKVENDMNLALRTYQDVVTVNILRFI